MARPLFFIIGGACFLTITITVKTRGKAPLQKDELFSLPYFMVSRRELMDKLAQSAPVRIQKTAKGCDAGREKSAAELVPIVHVFFRS